MSLEAGKFESVKRYVGLFVSAKSNDLYTIRSAFILEMDIIIPC